MSQNANVRSLGSQRVPAAHPEPPSLPPNRPVDHGAGTSPLGQDFNNLHSAELPPSMDVLFWVVWLVPQPRASAETPGLGLPRAPGLVALNSAHFKTTAGFD